jgi:hypothetical protein
LHRKLRSCHEAHTVREHSSSGAISGISPTGFQDAKRLRDQILGKKARGEIGTVAIEKMSCGELLDDLLECAEANIKGSTARIWKLVVEANLRPFFGHRKVAGLTTEISEGVPP